MVGREDSLLLPSLALQGRVGENPGHEFASFHVQEISEHHRCKRKCEKDYLKSFFFCTRSGGGGVTCLQICRHILQHLTGAS